MARRHKAIKQLKWLKIDSFYKKRELASRKIQLAYHKWRESKKSKSLIIKTTENMPSENIKKTIIA